MKIVASTKLTRAQRAMNESQAYGQTSNKVFESAETKPLEGEGKKTLYVVCSSDKGLCGGIHSGLSRFMRRNFAAPDHQPADLVLIGEKARAQLGRTNAKDIVLSFAGVGKDVPTFADAQAIADQISQLEGDYSDIKIVYNKFINATSYEPTIIEAYSDEAIANSPNFSAFEVDEELLSNLREYSLANSLFWALAEGHACEISARRNAMDVSPIRQHCLPVARIFCCLYIHIYRQTCSNSGLKNNRSADLISQNASKNAGEMINKYQILFNRTRQAVITGELVEIITGATASEDM
jgi:F-type H+-transporting ATPase subunit gamma